MEDAEPIDLRQFQDGDYYRLPGGLVIKEHFVDGVQDGFEVQENSESGLWKKGQMVQVLTKPPEDLLLIPLETTLSENDQVYLEQQAANPPASELINLSKDDASDAGVSSKNGRKLSASTEAKLAAIVMINPYQFGQRHRGEAWKDVARRCSPKSKEDGTSLVLTNAELEAQGQNLRMLADRYIKNYVEKFERPVTGTEEPVMNDLESLARDLWEFKTAGKKTKKTPNKDRARFVAGELVRSRALEKGAGMKTGIRRADVLALAEAPEKETDSDSDHVECRHVGSSAGRGRLLDNEGARSSSVSVGSADGEPGLPVIVATGSGFFSGTSRLESKSPVSSVMSMPSKAIPDDQFQPYSLKDVTKGGTQSRVTAREATRKMGDVGAWVAEMNNTEREAARMGARQRRLDRAESRRKDDRDRQEKERDRKQQDRRHREELAVKKLEIEHQAKVQQDSHILMLEFLRHLKKD